MQRFKILGLVFLAVLALGAIAAEAASAASTVLPEFSNEVNANGTSGTSTINFEGTALSCSSSVISFTSLSRKLGKFKRLYGGCRSGGESCRSLGQALGSLTIETTGEYHLVSLGRNRTFYLIWYLYSTADNAAAIHIECEGVVALMLMRGNYLGRLVPEPAGSERTFKIIFGTEGGGSTIKQELDTYGNNNGTELTDEGLKGKLGTGTERITAESSEILVATSSATSLEES